MEGLGKKIYHALGEKVLMDIKKMLPNEISLGALSQTILIDRGFGTIFSYSLLKWPAGFLGLLTLAGHELSHEVTAINNGTYNGGLIEIDKQEFHILSKILDGLEVKINNAGVQYAIHFQAVDNPPYDSMAFSNYALGTALQNLQNDFAPLGTAAVLGPLVVTAAMNCQNKYIRTFGIAYGLYLSFAPVLNFFANGIGNLVSNMTYVGTDVYHSALDAAAMLGIHIKDDQTALVGGLVLATTLVGNLAFYSLERRTADHIVENIKKIGGYN